MRVLLNTLYVMTQGSYINLDHETVKVNLEDDGTNKSQIPLHHLGSIICIGNIRVSSGVMAKCAADGRSLVWLDNNGRFLCRIEGPVSGNVLLRCAQHQVADDVTKSLMLARSFVAGKIQNSRNLLLRGARDTDCEGDSISLKRSAAKLANILVRLEKATNLEIVRGLEGEAAHNYFDVFESLIKADRDLFYFRIRNRRPPRDRVNALLSFLYTLLCHDCSSALEGVGLDPQIGYLHALRPGKPSLALDLMEEMRPLLAERIALTLLNRRQIDVGDFEEREGGAVYLNAEGRKKVVIAYQNRKKEEVIHPLLDKKIPIGLIMHVQARILARFLRGDSTSYLPFIYK